MNQDDPRVGYARVYQAAAPLQARPKLVVRPRLTARLEWDAGRKLTLISTPAGFGETTLLSEWLEGFASDERAVGVTLPDYDPTGGFFRDDKPLSW